MKTIDDSHLTTPRRDRGEVHARWNLETAGVVLIARDWADLGGGRHEGRD